MMKKERIIPIILAAVTVLLTVVSLILLPETVVTQVTSDGSNPTQLPKAAAVAIPALLGIGGAAASVFIKGEKKDRNKCLIVSAAGILVFVIMLPVNLL